MKYSDIPAKLFAEFAAKVGIGEIYEGWARESSLGGATWNLIEVDPAKYFSAHGLVGAIGWYKSQWGSTTFAVWDAKPKGDADNIFESHAVITIKALVKRGGMWAYGRGELLKEDIILSLDTLHGVSITTYVMPLIGDILKRAHELSLDCTHNQYWEVEVNPEGDYSKY